MEGRVRVIVACRTAEFVPAWRDALTEVVGSCTVAQLLPLRYTDAHGVATRAGCSDDDADALLARAGAIAAVPQTLVMALSRGHSEEDLDPVALYSDHVDLLLIEPDNYRPFPLIDSAHRRTLAGTVAAALTLGDEGSLSLRDGAPGIQLSQIAAPEGLDAQQLKTVTHLPLFRVSPAGIGAFTHATYRELLTAEWLATRSSERVTHLITNDGALVPPGLRGVLRWLVALQPDVYGAVLAANPRAAVHQELPVPADVAPKVVDGLLAEASEGRLLNLQDLRFGGLQHPGLAGQLRPVLQDAGARAEARRLAIRIARHCLDTELVDDLIEIAADTALDPVERQQAAYALRDHPGPTVRRLLLVLLDDPNYPDDELRGTALSATWPDILDLHGLIAVLHEPRTPNLFGAYKAFLLRDLLAGARPDHLPDLVRWAANAANRWSDTYDSAKILSDVLHHIADRQPTSDVVAAVADVLANLQSDARWQLHQNDDERPLFWTEGSSRRTLLRAILERTAADEDISDRFFGTVFHLPGLLHPDDLEWWCQVLQAAPAHQRSDLGAVVRSVFDPRIPRHRAVALSSDYSVATEDVFDFFLGSCSLDDRPKYMASEAARSQEIERRRQGLMARVINEDESWPNRFAAMHQLHRVLQPFGTSVSPAKWGGWKDLDPSSQGELLDAAKLYALDPTSPGTELSHGSWSIKNMALFSGLEVAMAAGANLVEGLPDERLAALCPLVISLAGDMHRELIALLHRRVPAAVRDAIRTAIHDRDGYIGRTVALLELLPGPEASDTVITILPEVRNDQAWEELLDALFRIGSQRAADIGAAAVDDQAAGPRRSMAAAAMLRHETAATWPRLAQVLQGEKELGRQVLIQLGERWQPPLTLPFPVLHAMARWACATAPAGEDRFENDVTWSGHDPGAVRRALLNRLRDEDDPRAPGALRGLARVDPSGDWGYRHLAEEAEQRLADTNQPARPWANVVAALAEDSATILSQAHLYERVLETLREFHHTGLRRHNRARSLWNDTPRRTPKDEAALSDLIASYLEDSLAASGAVVSREVEGRRLGKAGGEEMDILVSFNSDGAATSSPWEVVIEVKAVWNSGLLTAMYSQLGRRYLLGTGRSHGIYVVGWFNPLGWDPGDYRRRHASRWVPARLQDELDDQAAVTSKLLDVTIDTVVLDCSPEGTDGINLAPPSIADLRHQRSKILDLVRKHQGERAWVFGSLARDEAGPASDIDVVVEFQEQATLSNQGSLMEALSDLLGRPVDVVGLGALADDDRIRSEMVAL